MKMTQEHADVIKDVIRLQDSLAESRALLRRLLKAWDDYESLGSLIAEIKAYLRCIR